MRIDVVGNEMHDILMITYNRPEFTRMALGQLLGTCDDQMRVWIWHNGTDQATLDVVNSFRDHMNLYRVYVSEENKRLREPTNWFWETSNGEYLSKVDDDCLLPAGWAQKLRKAHREEPRFGVIGCWRFYEEDFVPELANKKIREYSGGHRIMRHAHVQGSGYVMKRKVYENLGPIRESEAFTGYCNRAAAKRWENGWYFPFIHEQHMDDARSPYYPHRSDEAFLRNLPLSAIRMGISSLEQWKARSTWLAHHLQEDQSEGASFFGWRGVVRKIRGRILRIIHRDKPWMH